MEPQGQRTGTERCPGEADLPGPEFPGRRAPTCPTCGSGTVPRPARGQGRRRLCEKDPQISPPSPTPKSWLKKIKSLPPASAAAASASRPARLSDPPVDASSSPVLGAAESRPHVTWICTRQEAATHPCPRGAIGGEQSSSDPGARQLPVSHLAPRLARTRFSESLPKGFFFFFLFFLFLF